MLVVLLATSIFLFTSSSLASAAQGNTSDVTDRQALVILATQGSVDAQYRLGVRYLTGEGGPQNDTEAATWLRKAAEQGHVDAQSSLALMYAVGLGIPKDMTEAAKWYREAAEQGALGLRLQLLRCTLKGWGFRKARSLPISGRKSLSQTLR